MMGFVDKQVAALSGKLSPKHVKSRRDGNGQTLFYIAGWHAIAEANRIFGFDAWDRQTLSTECVWQGAAHRDSMRARMSLGYGSRCAPATP